MRTLSITPRSGLLTHGLVVERKKKLEIVLMKEILKKFLRNCYQSKFFLLLNRLDEREAD